MNRTICVYSSSSCAVGQVYFAAAANLGREIALKGDSLIFGGGTVGLMGACAKAVHEHGGRVVGVIPEALNVSGVVYEYCDELIVTPGLRERKGIMDKRADAFVALPGGYGTLEELLEIITLKQLKYHRKPVAILNINGFYDKLLQQFDLIIRQSFAREQCRELYYVTDKVETAISYIDNYQPVELDSKWMQQSAKPRSKK